MFCIKNTVPIFILILIIILCILLFKYIYVKENFENIKIDNIALVIPIHPKHYDYIYNLIDKIYNEDCGIDIYLVFSSENDYSSFKKKRFIKHFILKNTYDMDKIESIVSYKKFYALDKLKNTNYDYFIVCDAEIDIIPKNFNKKNIINKIENIFKNKIIYAGEHKEHYNITKYSADILGIDNVTLKNETNNYELYYWWSDLPIYKREHIDDFLKKINYNSYADYDIDSKFFKFNLFDHLVYLNYLILYHNFNILNVTPLIGLKFSLEKLNNETHNQLDILKKKNYGFSYMNNDIYNKNKTYLINEGTFLIYHLDRKI